MSMNDPISDMLTQIKNGQMAKKATVTLPFSKVKWAILTVLQEEGYIISMEKVVSDKPSVTIHLKYFNEKPVIAYLKRTSRPGLRIYKKKDELPVVLGGLGIAIISTSSGVMSDKKARKLGQGGEVLCCVA
jgi:small subunit ribosomal protein S8